MRRRKASQPRRLSIAVGGRREPHRVAVDDAEHHEDDAEQVADEGGVEPHEPVAADERDRQRDRDADQAPHDAPTVKETSTRVNGHESTVVVETGADHPSDVGLGSQSSAQSGEVARLQVGGAEGGGLLLPALVDRRRG